MAKPLLMMFGATSVATSVVVPSVIADVRKKEIEQQKITLKDKHQNDYLKRYIISTFERLQIKYKDEEDRGSRDSSYCGIKKETKKGVCIPLVLFNTDTQKFELYNTDNPQKNFRKATLREAYDWAKAN